jgi:hypothetical protein
MSRPGAQEQRCHRCGAVVVDTVTTVRGRQRRRRMERSTLVTGHLALQESLLGELPAVVAVTGVCAGWRAHRCRQHRPPDEGRGSR